MRRYFVIGGLALAGVACGGPLAPVAYWAGDGNANDSAAAHHGDLRGGAAFAPGIVDQAFSFDGVDDFVDLGSSAIFDFGSNDFTIDFWARWNSVDGEQVLIAKWDNRPSFGGVRKSGWTLTKLSDNILRLAVGSSGQEIRIARVPPGGITAGTWNHIAVARSSETATIYWNGDAFVSGSLGSIDPTPFPLLFGRRSDRRGFFHNGLIDEVRIYNGALRDQEVKARYDAGSSKL